METKTCITCGKEKNIEDFAVRPDTGKRRNECRKCKNERERANSKKPKKVIEILPAGTKRCIGECGQIKSEDSFYLRKDTGKRKGECLECHTKRCALYQKEHSDEIADYQKQYKEDNKDELRVKRAKRERSRKRKDPVYGFLCCARVSVLRMFKSDPRLKQKHTIEYVGCSAKEGRAYIESKWKPGMDWTNQGKGPGKWQIDHIIPLGTIMSMDNTEGIKKVLHYTNLQPLWNDEHKIKTAQDMKLIRKLKSESKSTK